MAGTVTLLRALSGYRGLYARIAKRLKLDASYVSRVANGQRRNERISAAIEAGLNKIHTATRKGAGKSSKK